MSDAKLLQQKIVKYENMLKKTLNMLDSFGVIEGRGQDGSLMKEIRDVLDGNVNDVIKVLSTPNTCPLCGNRDYRECDCPPDEQWAAMNGV